MSGTTEALDPVRVLIVEDSEDQRGLLSNYFERAGCSVVAVIDGEAAVETWAAQRPELAVIDLILPGMHGWELVSRLRAEQPDCAIAVTSVLEERLFPPADAALPKPFNRAQVLSVLRDCVTRWDTK